jgi:hypothetical protein
MKNNIDCSKVSIKKSIKCKISTPKYMQINLKRNNFISFTDLTSGDNKLDSNDEGMKSNEAQANSKNSSKKDKFYIEFSKINSTNKSRGVSADEMMCGVVKKGYKQQAKSFKPFMDNLTKVIVFLINLWSKMFFEGEYSIFQFRLISRSQKHVETRR